MTDSSVEGGVRVDAWLPPEMAERAEGVGVKKAGMAFSTMLMLLASPLAAEAPFCTRSKLLSRKS